MHNDVQVSKNSVKLLMQGFDNSEKTAITAPLLNSTKIDTQKKEPAKDQSRIRTDRVDSCCFMIKNGLSVRFDPEYQLCYFEMDDFCRQLTESDMEIIVVRDTIEMDEPRAFLQKMGFRPVGGTAKAGFTSGTISKTWGAW